MSRKGNCWDNAVAESFFSSLKKERIKKHIYTTRDLARADVADCSVPSDPVSTEVWELQLQRLRDGCRSAAGSKTKSRRRK